MQVLALFTKIAARLGQDPAVPFLEAVEGISGCISRHLVEMQSDLLKADMTLTFPPGAAVTLPDDFAGFKAEPYCVELRRPLSQVSDDKQLSYTGTYLENYDLRGKRLSLFPAQIGTFTVKIIYLSRPVPIIDMTDDLPFDGTFDYLFLDLVLDLCEKGLELLSNPSFQRYVETKVNEVISNRQPVTFRRNGYFD